MPELTVQQAFEMAVEHHRAGRLQEAEHLYRQILALFPGHVATMYNLGAIAHQTGRYDLAVDLLRQVVAAKPEHAEAWCNLGDALKELGRLSESIDASGRAIALRPNYAQAHFNLATALFRGDRLVEAIGVYQQAVEFDPKLTEAYVNLGFILHKVGRFTEAVEAYQKAIAVDPKFVKAHFNLGNALKDRGYLDEATAAFEQAIALKADYAEAHCNLALTLKDKGQVEDAIAAFSRAVELLPNDPNTHSNLLFMPHYLVGMDAQVLANAHRSWSARHAEPIGQSIAPHSNNRDPDRALRIGYVSPDFHRHSVSYFLESLLSGHDQQLFQTYCYSNSPHVDTTTGRLKRSASHWREVAEMNDLDLDALIRRDQIDILVELSGHTAYHRLLVLARKPAPIQVTYLGYPDTTGMTTIDYRLTDARADPSGKNDSLYSEKLVRLPRTFLCYCPSKDAPAVTPPPSQSARYITFGSFNALPKINPPLVKIWAKILAQVANSRLLLKNRGLASPSSRQRLLGLFAAEGIAADRIELHAPSPDEQTHLQTYARMDIALDTFPYNGTATTCEAMWMGVPTITLAGELHAGRVGVSILSNVGLEKFIAQTPDDYVRIAVELAGDAARLADIRATIRQQIIDSPLMDAQQFARDVEAAYRRMWRTWCSDSR